MVLYIKFKYYLIILNLCIKIPKKLLIFERFEKLIHISGIKSKK